MRDSCKNQNQVMSFPLLVWFSILTQVCFGDTSICFLFTASGIFVLICCRDMESQVEKIVFNQGKVKKKRRGDVACCLSNSCSLVRTVEEVWETACSREASIDRQFLRGGRWLRSWDWWDKRRCCCSWCEKRDVFFVVGCKTWKTEGILKDVKGFAETMAENFWDQNEKRAKHRLWRN